MDSQRGGDNMTAKERLEACREAGNRARHKVFLKGGCVEEANKAYARAFWQKAQETKTEKE